MDLFGALLTDAGGQILSSITAAFVLATIGLNIHFGYTGLVNIGQAGFMLLGAYGYAITIEQGGPLWLALVIGLAAAAVFALILGLPTLRLRGDYLAIVTIAAAEIIRIVGDDQTFAQYTGGAAGIAGSVYQGPFIALSPLPKNGLFTIGPFTQPFSQGDSWWLRLVAYALVAVVTVLVALLVHSPWGRTIKAIREDEDAVRSLGKNSFFYKMQALVLGGVIGALGGIVFAQSASVQADSLGRTTTFILYTCLLLGGAATVFGPILGTFLYFVLIAVIQDVITDFVPASIINQEQAPVFTFVLVGIGLMLLVIFRPQGVLGNKKELSFGE